MARDMDRLDKPRKKATTSRSSTSRSSNSRSGSGRSSTGSSGSKRKGVSRKDNDGRRRKRATLRTYVMLAAILIIFVGLGAFLSSKFMGTPTTNSDLSASALARRQQEVSHRPKFNHDFQSLVSKGNKEFDRHHYPEARRWYNKALRLNPKAVAVLVDLGTCYFYSGAPKSAVAMYDRALRVDSDNRSALYNKGMVMSENGDPEGARFCWKEYLDTHPSDADALEVKSLMTKLPQ